MACYILWAWLLYFLELARKSIKLCSAFENSSRGFFYKHLYLPIVYWTLNRMNIFYRRSMFLDQFHREHKNKGVPAARTSKVHFYQLVDSADGPVQFLWRLLDTNHGDEMGRHDGTQLHFGSFTSSFVARLKSSFFLSPCFQIKKIALFRAPCLIRVLPSVPVIAPSNANPPRKPLKCEILIAT
jgi:hypothetical protein